MLNGLAAMLPLSRGSYSSACDGGCGRLCCAHASIAFDICKAAATLRSLLRRPWSSQSSAGYVEMILRHVTYRC